MEKESHNFGGSTPEGSTESASSRDKKANKKTARLPLGDAAYAPFKAETGKKPDKSAEPSPTLMAAWERLIQNSEKGEAPDGGKTAGLPDKMAEVIDLDERRRAKADTKAEQVSDTKADLPLAAGAENMSPTAIKATGASGEKAADHRSMSMNAEPPAGENGGASPEPETGGALNAFEQRAAQAPVGGEAIVGGPDDDPAEKASETFEDGEADGPAERPVAPGEAPEADAPNDDEVQDLPLPPTARRPQRPGPAPVPAQTPRQTPGQNPNQFNGYERTPADVSRAAWMGLAFGWLLGRRNKNKAVRRAVSTAEGRFKKDSKKRETEAYQAARHRTESAVKSALATERASATKTPAEWLKPETRSAAASRLSSERMTSTPVADLLAVPAAVAAARMIAERRGTGRPETSIDDSQVVEIAKTIRVDGIPLHQIYESKQIDKEGLRAVVAAYLRGESVEKQLTKEIVEKQKSFERDPRTRQRAPVSNGLRTAAGQVSSAIVGASVGLAQSSQRVASKVGNSVVGATSNMKRKGPASVPSATRDSGVNWLGIIAVVVIYALIFYLWSTRPQ